MQLGHYQFEPTLRISLIALTVFLILIALGLWQLDRAGQKIEIQQALDESLALPELDILNPSMIGEASHFRYIRLEGQFDTQHQYLLDNRIHKGRPGFLIITPFRYSNGEGLLLVNRGWLALGQTRQDLPNVDVSTQNQVIRGILADLPGKLPSFGVNATVKDGRWPQVVRDVEIEQISIELGYTMPPYLLQLEHGEPAAYMQNWQPIASGPEKNHSYAIQWFSMALVVFILFIGLNSRRSEE